MPKPIAVLISDVHYNIQTIELADAAVNMAIDKANELNLHLIVAGDLHDTKANMRAECVSAMLKTFARCKNRAIIMRGNHDSIHEKSESHALDFITHYADVFNTPVYLNDLKLCLIPYQHDARDFKHIIRDVRDNAATWPVIVHQGLTGSDGGHYFKDSSAVTPSDVAGLRVISGHYHNRQSVELPDDGRWDFLGNPYTLGWGEASHQPKGFHVLLDDGSLQFIPSGLRKHVVYEVRWDEKLPYCGAHEDGDLVMIKLSGTREQLAKVDKTRLGKGMGVKGDYRLELVPMSVLGDAKIKENAAELSREATLDKIIAELDNCSQEQKERLKLLWKAIV